MAIDLRAFALTLVGVGLFLAACSSGSNNSENAGSPAAGDGGAITVTDSMGREVSLELPAQRVVCMIGPCADAVSVLGIEPVGMSVSSKTLASHERFIGDGVRDVPEIGGTFFSPDIEAIIAAQPDLIIGGSPMLNLQDALAGVAPVYVSAPHSYEDSIQVLRDIAALTGRDAEAEAAIESFRTRLAAYKERSPGDRTALIMWGSDINFGISTDTNPNGSLLAEVTDYPWQVPAGVEEEGAGDIPFSMEGVLAVDPEFVFVETMISGGNVPQPLSEQLNANPLWSQVTAVRNGDVLEVDYFVWHTGHGLRSLEVVLDEAMTALYPDVFPEPLP